MQEIVQREMPEHDEDGIAAILTMVCPPGPFRGAEHLEASDQTPAIDDEPVEARVEIHRQQEVIGV
ncbi:MAG TPA: hypothetical protein VHM30_02880, partial [Gemmatimonadaceae bacterium]|nr:hypothetical protein [Gemmatimonadaceae bacterium]